MVVKLRLIFLIGGSIAGFFLLCDKSLAPLGVASLACGLWIFFDHWRDDHWHDGVIKKKHKDKNE